VGDNGSPVFFGFRPLLSILNSQLSYGPGMGGYSLPVLFAFRSTGHEGELVNKRLDPFDAPRRSWSRPNSSPSTGPPDATKVTVPHVFAIAKILNLGPRS
jgi:hypothetical protein